MSTIKVRPLGHYVLVEPIKVESKSKGGIITSVGETAEWE